jgi:anti-anti-sigma factor
VDVTIRLPAAPPEDYLRWVEWWREAQSLVGPKLPGDRDDHGTPAGASAAARLIPVHSRLVESQARHALLRERSVVAPEISGDADMWRRAFEYGEQLKAWLQDRAREGTSPEFPPDLVRLREATLKAIREGLSASAAASPDLVVVVPEECGGHFRVSGEIDLSNEKTLAELFEDELARGHRLVLDLSGVTFMDSQGLRLLIQLGSMARSRAMDPVVLVAVSEAVSRLLDLAVRRQIPGVEIRESSSEG